MSDVYNKLSNKYISKNFEDLKKLENKIFRILINTLNDSVNNRKYVQLAKFLVQRITNWKPIPSFPIYLQDIPIQIKTQINQLVGPEFYDLMNNVIARIYNYEYFIQEIHSKGYLKWDLI